MINVIACVVAREYWEIIADNLKKPVGAWAASQRLIPMGERFGLLTHAATTEKRFVVHPDEILTAFLELESAIQSPPIWIDKRAASCQPQRR